ncbi:hypothetical protein [Aneurinibacillus terranovensis]|uniref:hypothetical protein n=1 Tax=Aneurinibacillus terranovensis TaxID=278991 RepID=UPI000401CB88|nr:hypothetical protein [Aneurinibacillus terranovensis]
MEKDKKFTDFKEETAAEIAPGRPTLVYPQKKEMADTQNRTGTGIGTLALVLSLLSFFVMPFLLGIVGFVLGYAAARRGAASGRWAMGLSAVAVLLTLFLRPFY